ncbi:MAG: replication terminator protein [Sporolactobacillus sp.]
MVEKINLDALAGGAVAERFNRELQLVLNNIADPNTDAKKKRKLQLTVTFSPDEKRSLAGLSILAKKTLVPAKEIETQLVIGQDSTGRVVAKELLSGIPGQTFIDQDGDPATDTGDKILKFETTKTKAAGDKK